jgi:hypothetical protein
VGENVRDQILVLFCPCTAAQAVIDGVVLRQPRGVTELAGVKEARACTGMTIEKHHEATKPS